MDQEEEKMWTNMHFRGVALIGFDISHVHWFSTIWYIMGNSASSLMIDHISQEFPTTLLWSTK